eukprot:TRINITY_DN3512_c0_g1_i9.p1 TRINITY_DN3512_c0_g1~~TRINITY_DN3512_c0_g1_i9.p1  ORF type:complete len:5234 (+),score=1501.00 TRINITY_DN3512_c0_g1_i9:231-15932(+)
MSDSDQKKSYLDTFKGVVKDFFGEKPQYQSKVTVDVGRILSDFGHDSKEMVVHRLLQFDHDNNAIQNSHFEEDTFRLSATTIRWYDRISKSPAFLAEELPFYLWIFLKLSEYTRLINKNILPFSDFEDLISIDLTTTFEKYASTRFQSPFEAIRSSANRFPILHEHLKKCLQSHLNYLERHPPHKNGPMLPLSLEIELLLIHVDILSIDQFIKAKIEWEHFFERTFPACPYKEDDLVGVIKTHKKAFTQMKQDVQDFLFLPILKHIKFRNATSISAIMMDLPVAKWEDSTYTLLVKVIKEHTGTIYEARKSLEAVKHWWIIFGLLSARQQSTDRQLSWLVAPLVKILTKFTSLYEFTSWLKQNNMKMLANFERMLTEKDVISEIGIDQLCRYEFSTDISKLLPKLSEFMEHQARTQDGISTVTKLLDRFYTKPKLPSDSQDWTKLLLEPMLRVVKAKFEAIRSKSYNFRNDEKLFELVSLPLKCRRYATQFPFSQDLVAELKGFFSKFPEGSLAFDDVSALNRNLADSEHNVLTDNPNLPPLYDIWIRSLVEQLIASNLKNVTAPSFKIERLCAFLSKNFLQGRSHLQKFSSFMIHIFALAANVTSEAFTSNPEIAYRLPPNFEALFFLAKDRDGPSRYNLSEYRASISKILMKIQELVNETLVKNTTESQLQKMSTAINGINALFKAADVEILLQSDAVRDSIEEFKKVKTRLNELFEVGKWLRAVDVEGLKLPNFPANHDYTLNEALNFVEDFTDQLEIKDPQVFKAMTFFISKKSALFEAISSQHRKRHQKQVIRLEDVIAMVKEATEFLERLLDVERLFLSDFQQVYELTQQFKNSFAEELNIASEFFDTLNNYTKQDAAQRIEMMSNAFELLQFSMELPCLERFLDLYGIEAGEDAAALEHFAERLKRPETIRLTQVQSFLNEIKDSLSNLRAVHLRYFQAVHDAQELVEFLGNIKDYERTVQFLTGDLQGYQYGLDLLNNVITVKPLFDPIVELTKKRKRHDQTERIRLKDLFQSVHQHLQPLTEKELSHRIDKIKNVLERLPEIRVWFSKATGLTLDTILPFISHLLSNGLYRSRLSHHSQSEDFALHFRDDLRSNLSKETTDSDPAATRTLPQANLQDLVLGISIFINKDTIALEKLRDLQRFVDVYQLAQNIHSLRLELESIGHPQFQGTDESINSAGKMTIDHFREIYRNLQKKKKDWNEQLQDAYTHHSRLLFLDCRQLPRILSRLQALNVENLTLKSVQPLIPYVLACFPDYHNLKLPDKKPLISTELVLKSVQAIKPKADPILGELFVEKEEEDLQLADRSREYLEWAAQILAQVERSSTELIDEHDIPVPKVLPSTPEVVTAYRFDSWKLFELTVDLCNSVAPHPSQILWCGEKTTVLDIENFLNRSKCFQNVSFFVLGVNRLSLLVRDFLLNWTTSLFLSQTQNSLGPLSFVFTEHVGVEIFSFLKIQEKTEANVTPLKSDHPILSPQKVLGERKIRNFSGFIGEPSTGKSSSIKRDLRRLQESDSIDAVLNVSVNEDFSVTSFIEKLRSLRCWSEKKSRIGVHLNVSPYANYLPFSTFLSNFCIWGLIWDDSNGEMEVVHEDSEWYFMIELGLAPNQDPDYKIYSTKDQVINALPSVKLFANLNPKCSDSFEIGSDVALCCSFLDAFDAKTLGNPKVVLSSTSLVVRQNEDHYKYRLDRFFKQILPSKKIDLPDVKLFQKMFVSLLADRCRWLLEYSEYLVRLEKNQFDIKGVATCQDLFDLFIDESGHLCERRLRTSLSDDPPIYSIRSSSTEEDVSREVKFVNFSRRKLALPPGIPSLDLHEALAFPDVLRVSLAPGLGLLKTERMRSIVQQQNYVLTPDFSLKLVILNERRKILQNVILSGDTGVGKTELLSLYSTIINSDSDLVPDLLFETHMFVFDRLITSPETKNLRHPNFQVYAKTHRTKGEEKRSPSEEFPRTVKGITNVLRAIAEEKKPAGPLLEGGANGQFQEETFFPLVAHSVVQFIKSSLEKYQLIVRTPLLERVFAYQQPLLFAPNADQNPLVVRDIEELEQLTLEFLSARFHNLFHKILMHQKITSNQFKLQVREIVEKTRKLTELVSSVKVVVFIDEFNTTTIMGLLKEVLVDRSLDGIPLPNNIFWVAAMNPIRNDPNEPKAIQEEEMMEREAEKRNFTGVNSSDSVFAVRPILESMQELVLDFSKLKTEEEEFFLRVYLDLHSDLSEAERDELKSFIHFGQQFVRDANIFRVHVSIRDIIRATTLYRYFRFSPAGNSFMLGGNYFGVRNSYHWPALILAIAMTYYFRLDTRGNHSRHAFQQIFDEKLRSNRSDFMIQHVLFEAMKNLYDQTVIPPGIARTNALMENLFCVVVCIDTKIPLIITGPAGCSKTLSFSIAIDNMKGKQSPSAFYKNFHHVHPFRYQCSELSTDTEIEATYSSAIDRQNTFENSHGNSAKSSACSVVFLDEAGLPSEEKMPLKVLHFHLDHPKVASVILSNKTLDAAKTNRALQLFQSSPSHADLTTLAIGCIFGNSSRSKPSEKNRAVIEGLCKAFEKSNDYSVNTRKEMFHLRDFVYLLRYLRKHCTVGADNFEITPEKLIRGLQRNFNGIREDDFKSLVSMFFDAINESLDHFGQPDHNHIKFNENALSSFSSLDLIRESLEDRLEPGENPNIASFRYVMLIDPTNNEAAVSLLFSLGLCDPNKTVVCSVGDFEDDAKEIVRSEVVLQVKSAMAKGETVVLINSGPIRSSFYDVFNRHFAVMAVDDRTEGGQQEGQNGQVRFQYYANVAVGSFSRPCVVHPDFKVIVHVPETELPNTQLPFLNRFEKYPLSVETALREKITARKWMEIQTDNSVKPISIVDVIAEGCHDMISQLHDRDQHGRLLYGVIPRETVSSFVLSVVENSTSTNVPEIPPPFFVPNIQENQEKRRARRSSISHREEIVTSEEIHVEGEHSPLKEGKQEMGQPKPDLTSPRKVSDSIDYEEEEDFVQEDDDMLASSMFDTSSSPLKRLREWIRYANLHLIQLIRPESAFFCRKLPKAYVSEYLLRQEHFNLIRFLHRLLRSHFFPAEKQKNQSNKWCVFTRSSGELLRLHSDSHLKGIVLEPLLKRDVNVPQSREDLEGMESLMNVISLSSLHSSKACENLIEQFAFSSQEILLCTVDMSICTQNQVNFVRTCIDRHVPRKLVVLILHFPPEMGMLSKPCYHAVYLNRWDFLYVDSLGITTGVEPEDEQHDHSNETDSHRRIGVDVDARSWIASAFGLEVAHFSADSIKLGFRDLFFSLVQHFCGLMGNQKWNGRKLQHTRLGFYSDPKKRFSYLKKLFDADPRLYEGMLVEFSKSWTSSLLHFVVTEACKAIQTGQVVGSLLFVVRRSFRFLLGPMVAQLLRTICSNYNLEPISQIFLHDTQEKKEENEKSVQLVLETLKRTTTAPSLPKLIEKMVTMTEPNISIQFDIQFPSHLPLYSVISERLQRILSECQQKIQGENRNELILYKLFSETVKKDPIGHVIEMIRGDSQLFHRFQCDFVTRTMKMPHLEGIWLTMSIQVLNRLNNFARGDLLGLYCIDEKKFYFLSASFKPLQAADIPTDDKLLDLYRKDMPIFDDPKEVELFTSNLSIALLWNRLRTLLTEENHGGDDEFSNWILGYRLLFNRVQTRKTFPLAPDQLCRFDFMHSVFLLHLHYEISAVDLLALLRNGDVVNSIPDFATHPPSSFKIDDRDLTEDLTGPSIFCSVVHFSERLTKTLSSTENPKKESKKSYSEDLFSWFLLEKPPSDLQEGQVHPRLPKESRMILVEFLELIQNEPFRSLLSEQWIFGVLSSWLYRKPSSWTNGLLRAASSLVSQSLNPGDIYEYSPDLLGVSVTPEGLQPPVDGDLRKVEDIVFLVLLGSYEILHSDTALSRICEEYQEILHRLPNVNGEESVSLSIEKSLMATLALKKAAQLLSNLPEGENSYSILTKWREGHVLKSLSFVLSEDLKSGGPRQSSYYFLQLVQPASSLLSLLQSSDSLSLLKIERFIVDPNVTANSWHLFSFMVETQSPLGKMYQHIKQLVASGNQQNFQGAITRYAANPDLKLKTRMMLILVCYYDYYDPVKGCPFVQNQLDPFLKEALSVTPQEMLGYRLVTSVPSEVADDVDPLLYQFSRNARTTAQWDSTMSHIMINCLAVALGSPPDSNHLYPRIFQVASLNNQLGPGSDHQHKNYDCGFVLQHDNLTNNLNIMGNNRIYRLALNSTVWASVALSCVLDPANVTLCSTNHHFINYWKQDALLAYNNNTKVEQRKRQRTVEEQIKYYVFSRAQVFFQVMCQDEEVIAQHIDGVHFLNESLFHLWRIVNSEGDPNRRNPSLRSVYPTEHDVVAYENTLKGQVFDEVKSNYGELKKTFQKALQDNQKLKLILDLQDFQSLRYSSPLLSNAAIQGLIAGSSQILDADYPLISHFWKHRNQLRALKFLPQLVHFYRTMNRVFAYRITEEESLEWNFEKCVEKIEKYEDKKLVEEVRETFREMKKVWKEVSELADFVACPGQRRDRGFEEYVLHLHDQTMFASLLSWSQDLGIHDELIRLIRGLTNRQDQLLGYCEHHVTEGIFRDALLKNEENVSLDMLLYDVDQTRLLLDGELGYCEVSAIVLSHCHLDKNLTRTSLRCDWKRVQQDILRCFISGRATFENVESTFRTPFSFLLRRSTQQNDENAEIQEISTKDQAEEARRALQQTGSKSLRQIALSVKSYPELCSPLENIASEMPLVKLNLKGKSEEELSEAIDFLTSVLQHVKQQLASHENIDYRKETIDSAFAWLQRKPKSLRNLRHLKLSKIHHLSLYLVEKYNDKSFLFQDVSAQLDQDLGDVVRLAFATLESDVSSFSSVEDLELWKDVVQTVYQTLMEPEVRLRVQANSGKSLRKEVIREEFLGWTHNLPLSVLDRILPEIVVADNYAPYMRFLNRLLGELWKKHQEFSSLKEQKGITRPYQELVPEGVRSVQIELVHGEQIQLPPSFEKQIEQVLVEREEISEDHREKNTTSEEEPKGEDQEGVLDQEYLSLLQSISNLGDYPSELSTEKNEELVLHREKKETEEKDTGEELLAEDAPVVPIPAPVLIPAASLDEEGKTAVPLPISPPMTPTRVLAESQENLPALPSPGGATPSKGTAVVRWLPQFKNLVMGFKMENFSAMKKFLPDKQISEVVDTDGNTLLHLCCQHGKVKLANELLQNLRIVHPDLSEYLLRENNAGQIAYTYCEEDTQVNLKLQALLEAAFA